MIYYIPIVFFELLKAIFKLIALTILNYFPYYHSRTTKNILFLQIFYFLEESIKTRFQSMTMMLTSKQLLDCCYPFWRNILMIYAFLRYMRIP